jgi:AcrR family transcriptional regulator
VFGRQFEAFLGGFLESIPDTDDIEHCLRYFISNYLDRLAAHPEVLPFVLWEIRQGGDTMAALLQARLSRGDATGRPFMIGVLDRAMRAGRVRPADPTHLLVSLIGACVYPFIARPVLEKVMPGLDLLSPPGLERRKEEVFNLFWAALRVAPAERTSHVS